MSRHKDGMPFTYNDALSEIVGIRNPNGSELALGKGNAITIGNNGQCSNIADALYLRGQINHVTLTSFTGSITGSSTGSVDIRKIVASSGTPLSAYLNKKIVGVRINGTGNPIVRARVVKNNTLELMAPIPKDFSAVSIEVFDIVPCAIVLLPGTLLEISDRNLKIPAFTTIAAAVEKTATIRKIGGSGTSDVLFTYDNTQNEILFTGLVLEDARYAAGSRFIQFPAVDNGDNLQMLCNYAVKNCQLNTESQDMIYVSSSALGASGIGGGLFISNNEFTAGSFDTIFTGDMRHTRIENNRFNIYSESDAVDGCNPCAFAMSSGPASAYVSQRTEFVHNTVNLLANAGSGAGDASVVEAVSLRGSVSSAAKVFVKGNNILARKKNGSGTVVGLQVNGGGSQTPYIEATGNTFDCVDAGSGGGYSMTSLDAGYVIHRAGNNVINGTLGTNTAAITTV